MKIWLTQSSSAFTELQPALQQQGHEVYRRPLVATARVNPQALDAALSTLRDCRWLLFTSQAAVMAYRSVAALSATALSAAGEVIVGAVGPGTAAALVAADMPPAIVADGTATSLAAAFLAHPLASGGVGLPCGDRALPTLSQALKAGGHRVVTAVVYHTVSLEPPSEPGSLDDLDAVFVASPSAAQALPEDLPEVTVVAIGATTAAAVKGRGRACYQATAPTVAALVDCFGLAQAGLEWRDCAAPASSCFGGDA